MHITSIQYPRGSGKSMSGRAPILIRAPRHDERMSKEYSAEIMRDVINTGHISSCSGQRRQQWLVRKNKWRCVHRCLMQFLAVMPQYRVLTTSSTGDCQPLRSLSTGKHWTAHATAPSASVVHEAGLPLFSIAAFISGFRLNSAQKHSNII